VATNEEILMLEFLTLQVIAAIFGTASIGTADWLFLRARVGRRLHSLWVSSSSTAICLPVLTWTTNVFLGLGMVSLVLVGALGAIIFFWMYRNLLTVPPVQKVRSELLAPHSSTRPVPPSLSING
jgi:hypothetical protein